MFRDTFAVELLLAGMPLDQVVILLTTAGLHASPFTAIMTGIA
jgi:hypothetical protein